MNKAFRNESTPSKRIPTILKGMDSSHRNGKKISRAIANGQQSTRRMHQRRNFIMYTVQQNACQQK